MQTKELTLLENVSLAPLSTFAIGGPARYFTSVQTNDELLQALRFAKDLNIPFHIIGKGSNTLFDDNGFNGLVIQNKISFYKHEENIFHVGAGFSFAHLGIRSAKLGFTGLEFASGIPASVGGALYMNAGAQGQEAKDCLKSVEFLDNNGKFHIYQKADLHFSYRHSSFQEMVGVIIAARFELKKDQEAKNRQLTMYNYRKSTQPYSDKSCGCIFKNPTDISAGALIEKAGLKGLKCGGAEVSLVHANFIVNKNGAKASDVLALVKLIKTKVKEMTGIELIDEIKFIPFEKET